MTHFNRVTGNLKLMILCVCIELWQQFLCLGQGALVCHGEISSCLKYIIAIGVLKVWGEEEYVLGTVIPGLGIASWDVKCIAVAGSYGVDPGVVALHVFDHIHSVQPMSGCVPEGMYKHRRKYYITSNGDGESMYRMWYVCCKLFRTGDIPGGRGYRGWLWNGYTSV